MSILDIKGMVAAKARDKTWHFPKARVCRYTYRRETRSGRPTGLQALRDTLVALVIQKVMAFNSSL